MTQALRRDYDLAVGDFALRLGPAGEYFADLAIEDDDVAADTGLLTAVLVCLGIDRRADDSDQLRAGETDRRGWWGDSYSEVPDDRQGSLEWIVFDTGKITPSLVPDIERYTREALSSFIEDGVAEKINVTITLQGNAVLRKIELVKPDGEIFRHAHLWDGSNYYAI